MILEVVAVGVSGMVTTCTSVLDKDLRTDAWRQFWSSREHSRAQVKAAVVHLIAGVVGAIAFVGLSPFPETGMRWWEAVIRGIGYGLVAEAFLRAEVDVEPASPGYSVLRKAVKRVARKADRAATMAVGSYVRNISPEILWAEVQRQVVIQYGADRGKHYDEVMDNLDQAARVLIEPATAPQYGLKAKAEAKNGLARMAYDVYVSNHKTIDGFATIEDALSTFSSAEKKPPSGTPPPEQRIGQRRSGEERRITIDVQEELIERRVVSDRRKNPDRRKGGSGDPSAE